jgi:hypothetical protein
MNKIPSLWKIRRRIVSLTLLFSACSITYLMVHAEDTELHQSIANGLILLSGSVISSYIFGATWDDKISRND